MSILLILLVLLFPTLELPGDLRRVGLTRARVTVYQLVPEQTDGDPDTFADGTTRAELAGVRVCAASRDLLARWGGPIEYGDLIYIGRPVYRFCHVHDTMAKRAILDGKWQPVVRTIDIVSEEIGKWEATIYEVGFKD